MTIGQRIKELRKKKKLTQTGLADALGLTFGQISHYETDRHKPTVEHLQELAKFLGVSVSEITGDYSNTIKNNDFDAEFEKLKKENEALKRENDLLRELRDALRDKKNKGD